MAGEAAVGHAGVRACGRAAEGSERLVHGVAAVDPRAAGVVLGCSGAGWLLVAVAGGISGKKVSCTNNNFQEHLSKEPWSMGLR